MYQLIEYLVDAIYSEPRAGRPVPQRIELGADLFRRVQAAHREALATVLPEVDNVYPGSLAGVPVMEVSGEAAALVRANGERCPLELPGS